MNAPRPPLHDCGCLDVDAAGIITAVNDTFVEWVGDDRDAIIGCHFSDLVELRLPSQTDAIAPGDAIIRTRSGHTFPVAIGRVTESEDGTTQVAAFDVGPTSGFQRPFGMAAAKIDRGMRRLQILYNASVGFAEVRTDREAAELLADVALRSYAATAVSVHLTRGGVLQFVAGENPLAPYWPKGYKPTGAGTVAEAKVLIVPDPDASAQYAPGVDMPGVYRAAGVQSVLAAPILSKGSALGSFICYFDHPRTFDEEAVPLAEALANQTAQAIQRARFEEALRSAALHDELTGLPSRRLLEELVAEALATTSSLPAVLFIDLDGFKQVNDTLGHAAGDVLLTQVGQRLAGVIREGDVIGRFGGDEFIAVAHVHDIDEAAVIAERIRAAFDAPFLGISRELHVTASIGVAMATTADDLVLEHLVRVADQTMYRAKLSGGNRVVIAGSEPVLSAG